MTAYSTSTEYVDKTNGIRLIWSSAHHWRSYTLDGDYIESLSGNDVREWLAEEGYDFHPVGQQPEITYLDRMREDDPLMWGALLRLQSRFGLTRPEASQIFDEWSELRRPAFRPKN